MRKLISKVYFPRMIIPASAVITSFVDFLVSFLILVGMMAWYRFWPGWQILTLPLFMALAFLAAVGPGLWITALNVKYRDFRYVIPFLVQFGLYVSPVGYSSDVIRQRFGDMVFLLYSLNPMVAVIDGFRWAILGGEVTIYWPGFLLSLLVDRACSWLSASGTFARPRGPSPTSSAAMPPIISVENLGKRYTLRHQVSGPRYRRLSEELVKRSSGLSVGRSPSSDAESTSVLRPPISDIRPLIPRHLTSDIRPPRPSGRCATCHSTFRKAKFWASSVATGPENRRCSRF